MKKYEFAAVIQKHERLNSGYVEFPYDVEKEFGTKGRVPVKVWFEGVEYRGSLVKMGHPHHFVGLTQEIRTKINKNPGDKITVVLEQDTEERKVEIPVELVEKFNQDKVVQEIFNKLSYSHQKEYIGYINEAKKPETRQKRIDQTIVMLKKLKK